MTSDLRSVAGRVAFITGAASGMGRAVSLLFASQGAKVACSDIDGVGVANLADEIAEAGGIAYPIVLDVSDPDQIKAAVNSTREHLGPVDIVVNNAGLAAGGPIDSDEYEDQWALALDVLLTPHQRIIRACLPDLRASDSARIINIASTEGISAQRNASPYTAAKHGVVGLTRSLAVELGRDGITVNAICPGPILTGITEPIPADMRDTFARRRTALRRYGDPMEVAHMILNLALPASSYVTGAIIPVDGGLTAKND